jgi:hypothetical protein
MHTIEQESTLESSGYVRQIEADAICVKRTSL